MTRTTVVLLGMCALGASLIAGAIWGARRTHTAGDYLIANRRLSLWLTGLSHTANAMPAWLLFAVSGAAFAWGLSATWLACALLAGLALNWFYVAPRLRRMAAGHGSVSVVQILGAQVGERLHATLVRSSALILVLMLVLLISGQLHLFADFMANEFGMSATAMIIVTTAAIALYVAVGGYWAASLADAVMLIAVLALVLLLPWPAIMAAGGLEQLSAGFAALGPNAGDLFGGRSGVVAVAYAAGAFGLGIAMPGQPQALSRFIAARDEATLRSARWISLGCAALMLAGLLVCGWVAQVLYAGLADPELSLIALATRILPPGIGAVIALILLTAFAASVSGYLLVLAALVTADLQRAHADHSITAAHLTTVIAAIIAACIALYLPMTFLDRSLLAFTVLGSSFGPLVLVRVAGKRVRPGAALAAMWAGAILTILFHLLPDSPGDFLERVLPFVAALGIALSGGERRSNPDRADRSQETVHDRVPI